MEEYDAMVVTKVGMMDEGESVHVVESVACKDEVESKMKKQQMGSLYSCKFNSGSFGIEWEDTRKVIEEVFKGSDTVMRIISPS